MKQTPLLVLLIAIALSQNLPYQFIPMPSGIENITAESQNFGRTTYKKIINDSLIQSIEDINYQISARMYFTKGEVSTSKMHDVSSYTSNPNLYPKKSSKGNNAEEEENPCSLYPTSIQVHNHKQLKVDEIPREPRPFFLSKVIDKDTYKKTLGYFFINVMKNNTVKLIEVLGAELKNKKLGYDSLTLNPIKDLEFDDNGVSSNDRYFFNVSDTVYILNGQSVYEFKPQTFKAIKLGQLDTENKRTLNAGLLSRNQSYSTDFYIVNPSQIEIYRIHHGELTVNQETNLTNPVIQKIRDYDNVTKNINVIRSAIYHEPTKNFYITSQDHLYIISSQGPDYFKKGYVLNGSCFFNNYFQTTIHLYCNYAHTSYVLEAYFKNDTVILNRYYTDWDIEGIKEVYRTKHGRMIILGDQKFLIQGYGINRNILIDMKHYQPYDVIPFPIGGFLYPIAELTTQLSTTVLMLSEVSLKIVSIVQSPPELYCKFQGSQSDKTYSVLMQYNVSRCPNVKNPQTSEIGSTQTFCTVSKPVLIKNIEKPLQIQQTNVISGAVIALIVIGIIVVIGCGIKMHRRIEEQIKKLRSKISQVKNKKKGSEMKNL